MNDKIARLNEAIPNWRELRYMSGAPKFNPETGMQLDPDGNRSIFDDVDE